MGLGIVVLLSHDHALHSIIHYSGCHAFSRLCA